MGISPQANLAYGFFVNDSSSLTALHDYLTKSSEETSPREDDDQCEETYLYEEIRDLLPESIDIEYQYSYESFCYVVQAQKPAFVAFDDPKEIDISLFNELDPEVKDQIDNLAKVINAKAGWLLYSFMG